MASNRRHHRSTAVRWAVLAAKIVAGVAALFAYVANEVGDVFAPVRTTGPVGDRSVREGYVYSHLVTAAQIATIHPHMSGTCYDYPIAGTGHLYDGFTVADEAELCLSYSRDGRHIARWWS